MKKIDLNCDLGESFGNYKIGLDDEVIRHISSANVACGFHASDPLVMQKTVALAKENGVCIGAHPGFPDLVGFGRRNMSVSPSEAKALVQYQIGALDAFCKAAGVKLCHVKPHGALYNMAGKDEILAQAVCEGIFEYDSNLILLGLSGSKMIEAGKKIGLRTANEVFADRAYEDDGSLVARSKPGAVITDENLAVSRVVEMVKNGRVTSITGNEIEIKADSICLHGDGVKAVEFAKRIKEELLKNDVEIVPLRELV
ncbi:MAG: LamB/YcsF family protein [Acutalibacteraceae bacterium]